MSVLRTYKHNDEIFKARVAMGLEAPGIIPVTKFGFNPAVGTAREDIWSAGGVYPFQTTASTLEAISSSANDAASGTGAESITVFGLDIDFNLIQESITLAGLSASTATTQTFFRVYRAVVNTVGTYGGANIGTITVRISSAGATQAEIPLSLDGLGAGSTQMCIYTVPAGYSLIFWEVPVFSVESGKDCSVWLRFRQDAGNTTTPAPTITLATWSDVGSRETVDSRFPVVIPQKTDMWFAGEAQTGTTEVSIDFQAWLVADDRL